MGQEQSTQKTAYDSAHDGDRGRSRSKKWLSSAKTVAPEQTFYGDASWVKGDRSADAESGEDEAIYHASIIRSLTFNIINITKSIVFSIRFVINLFEES